MPYITYIVQSASGQLYVGQTQNLHERLRRHNTNRSRFTSGRGPWELVYAEEFSTRAEAVKKERELKKRHSRKALLKIAANTPVG